MAINSGLERGIYVFHEAGNGSNQMYYSFLTAISGMATTWFPAAGSPRTAPHSSGTTAASICFTAARRVTRTCITPHGTGRTGRDRGRLPRSAGGLQPLSGTE
jgi:hypothetical protein